MKYPNLLVNGDTNGFSVYNIANHEEDTKKLFENTE
jgi:hypothetical protein